jgi:hypothetical protein
MSVAGHVGEDPRAGLRPWFLKRLLSILLLMLVLTVAVSMAARWVGSQISLGGHTDDATLHEIVIGNNVMSVPANMIRFEGARQSGSATRLDLYWHWPDLGGYSSDARDAFNHEGGSREIVFVTFEERVMSQDMSGRFEPIYKGLIEDRGRAGPAGLVVHRFKESAGYGDEVLIVGERGHGRPFVARCLWGEAAAISLAPCERDVHLGRHVSMTYRFPAELAPQWRELDDAMLAKARGLISTR